MKKRTRTIIVVLLVAIVIGAMSWLVVRWNAAGQGRIVVTTTGPLDIRLWGIRPDAGGAIYDPNGKKIRDALGIAQWGPSHWRDDSQRFDFIFELPDTNELPLFTWFPNIEASYENRPLGGGFGHRFLDYKGKKLLWLTTTFPRTFRRSVLFGLWTADCDVETIDITLSYYHGPPGKAAFTIRGPFEPNDVMTSEDGVHKVAFMADGGSVSRPYAQFVLTTSAYFRSYASVAAYDSSRRRYLAGTGNVSLSTNPKQGSRIEYNVQALPLKVIDAIAFGEDNNRITFKNVNLNVARRNNRNHADYLDEMAERLDPGFSTRGVAEKRFSNAAEAIEFMEIVRGRHVLHAGEAILRGRPGSGGPPTVELVDVSSQRLKKTAHRWTRAMEPEFRAMGVRVGLFCKWPEFVEPAFELLDYPAMHDEYSARMVWSKVAQALADYRAELSDHAIARLAQILLRRDERDNLMYLKQCFWSPKSEARIEALWELANDDRSWLWWDAIEKLAQWKQFDGRHDSLTDKLKLRLFLIRGAYGFSNAEQIAPKAYALLDGLLTLQLLALDVGTFNRVLDKILRNPDRRFATAALINYLGRIEGSDSSATFSITIIVKYINLWHGLDIGGLGTDVTQDTGDTRKYDWPAITAEAIEWYEDNQDANDANTSVEISE